MKRKFIIMIAAMIAAIVAVTAQTVDTTGLVENPVLTDPTVTNLLDAYNVLYGALVIAWGYVAKLLGLKAKVSNFVFVVLAGGAVLAGAFIMFGIGKALPLLFSFLSAIGVYDIIFKPLFGARKPA